MPNLEVLIDSANETQLRLALKSLLLGLDDIGFGTDEEINGGDCVDAINDLYLDVTQRVLGGEQPWTLEPTDGSEARPEPHR